MNWGCREECHCLSTVWGWKEFDIGGILKITWYVVKFRAQKRALVFQHKSLFNLVKDFFKWIEGLVRSVTVQLQPEAERIFDIGGIQKKYSIRCQISRSKTRYNVST